MTPGRPENKPVLRQVALVLVAGVYGVSIGQLMFGALHLPLRTSINQHAALDIAMFLPCATFAAMIFSIVARQQLSKWFILSGIILALLGFTTLNLEFWQACIAGLACAVPLLYLTNNPLERLSTARFIHHLHNLQQLTILLGMGLSLWHESLRLPVLLTIVSGMAHWNRLLVGACPLTLLEARLTNNRSRAELLAKQGYFLFYLRRWTGWPITRTQLTAFITVLISSMLGQWVLV